MRGFVGKNRPAVHNYVQYSGPGEPRRGLDSEIPLDFPLEAHGLEQDSDSGKTVLNLDVHVFSLSSSNEGRPQ